MIFPNRGVPVVIWLILSILLALLIAFVPFNDTYAPFVDDVDRDSPQFKGFQEKWTEKHGDRELRNAMDYNFQTFGESILKMIIISVFSMLLHLFLTSPLLIKSKKEEKASPFMELGKNVNDSKCLAVFRELEWLLKGIKNNTEDLNVTALAAKYTMTSYQQLNVLQLIEIHQTYGVNSWTETLWRLHYSKHWNVFITLIIVAHIWYAFLESSLRGPVPENCSWFMPCNLQFKAPKDMTDSETFHLLIARLFMIVFCFCYVADVLLRCYIYSVYKTTSNNPFTAWHNKWGLLLQAIIVLFMAVDDVIIQFVFNMSLEFLFAVRPILIIVRNERITQEVMDIFAALHKARNAILLLLNMVMIFSVISLILFGNTWEYGEPESADDGGGEEEEAARRLFGVGKEADAATFVDAKKLIGDDLLYGEGDNHNMFSDIIRSGITMFVMTTTGENMVDLVFKTWSNPVLGKGYGLYWWFVVIVCLFVLTPLVISAICEAFAERREKIEEMQRAQVRTGVIAAMIMMDISPHHSKLQLTRNEFEELLHEVADIDTPEVQAMFQKLDAKDKVDRLISITQFVEGVDDVFEENKFGMAPLDEREMSTAVTYLEQGLDILTNTIVVIQFILLSINCSRGIYAMDATLEETEKQMKNRNASITIDALLLIAMFLHLFIVWISILSDGPIAYFYPSLYWKNGHLTHAVRILDFLLVTFCSIAHLTVVFTFISLQHPAPNDDQSSAMLCLLPWHAFTAEEAFFRKTNLVDPHRIWMSLTVFRILLIGRHSRKSMACIVYALQRMTTLALIGFCFLFWMGVLGVSLFRAESEYNDVQIYDNLSSAFASFSQAVVGEAFYELVYAGIAWKYSWAAAWYFIIYHFFFSFLFADLFFGMLLDGSHAASIMVSGELDDDDDSNDDDDTKKGQKETTSDNIYISKHQKRHSRRFEDRALRGGAGRPRRRRDSATSTRRPYSTGVPTFK